MTQTYDYSKRYRGGHAADRQRAISKVQISHSHALCPMCWGKVPIDLYNRPNGLLSKRRERNSNWMEAHHLMGYEQFSEWDLIPVCRTCHMKRLHHPGVWKADRRHPEQNRNVYWFRAYVRVRFAVAVLAAASIRSFS